MSNQKHHTVDGIDGKYKIVLRSGVWTRKPSVEVRTPNGKILAFDFHNDEDIKTVNVMIASSGYKLIRESLESFPTLVLANDDVADMDPPPSVGEPIYPVGGTGFATHIVEKVKDGVVYMKKTDRANEQCSFWNNSDRHERLTETPCRIFWVIWRRTKKP